MFRDVKKSNPNDSQFNNVVKDLTHVVDKEVKAFQSLFEVLLQQGLLISSQKENSASGIGPYTEQAKRITNSQLAPMVEQQYVQRLGELKDVLYVLSNKIQNTNKRNQSMLENSLKHVDKCLYVLEQGHVIASNQDETKVNNERSSYRGAE